MLSRFMLAAIASLLILLPCGAKAQMELRLTVEFVNGEEKHLTLDDLDAMDQVEFSTSTIWTDGIDTFSGVPVISILKLLGAEGETVKLTALNDYSVEMPYSDLDQNAPIVATHMNGETMSVREKGPFWIMYPFDRDASYQTEVNYSRSVWQLTRLKMQD